MLETSKTAEHIIWESANLKFQNWGSDEKMALRPTHRAYVTTVAILFHKKGAWWEKCEFSVIFHALIQQQTVIFFFQKSIWKFEEKNVLVPKFFWLSNFESYQEIERYFRFTDPRKDDWGSKCSWKNAKKQLKRLNSTFGPLGSANLIFSEFRDRWKNGSETDASIVRNYCSNIVQKKSALTSWWEVCIVLVIYVDMLEQRALKKKISKNRSENLEKKFIDFQIFFCFQLLIPTKRFRIFPAAHCFLKFFKKLK